VCVKPRAIKQKKTKKPKKTKLPQKLNRTVVETGSIRRTFPVFGVCESCQGRSDGGRKAAQVRQTAQEVGALFLGACSTARHARV
jgi:hypothetical protein